MSIKVVQAPKRGVEYYQYGREWSWERCEREEKCLLSHFWPHYIETPNVRLDLHDDISIRHAAIHHEMLEFNARVRFHRFDDGASHIRDSFKRGACNVAGISVLREAYMRVMARVSKMIRPECVYLTTTKKVDARRTDEHATSRCIPVRCEKSSKGGNEIDASGCRFTLSEGVDFWSRLDDTHLITEPKEGLGVKDLT